MSGASFAAPAPRIVSIQSQPIFGCAGNSAAVPLLQALGATVYAVPTVLLSNTPHYATIAVRDIRADFFEELLERLLERVDPTTLDAVLVGYVRRVDLVGCIARFIDRVRAAHPDVTVLVDPVMGDIDLGLYVPEDACRRIRDELVPRADICTPNVFEASVLGGGHVIGPKREPDDPVALLAQVVELGPSTVVLTGIGLARGSPRVTTRLWQRGERWQVTTPVINLRPTGTGDLLSAAFLYHAIVGHSAAESLRQAVALVTGTMSETVSAGRFEMEPSRLPDRMSLPNVERLV